MGFATDFLRRKKSPSGDITNDELKSHHSYQNDLLADGFISPIVLPSDRLQTLMDGNSVDWFSRETKLSVREIDILLKHDEIEPTATQLISISHAFNCSVIWLLGYHTSFDPFSITNDTRMITLLSRRNAAEASQYRDTSAGFMQDIMLSFLSKRLTKYNLAISNLAARHVAMEHLELSNEELYVLFGHPVYLELPNDESCWGLVFDEEIATPQGMMAISANGQKYSAYLTPNIAINVMG